MNPDLSDPQFLELPDISKTKVVSPPQPNAVMLPPISQIFITLGGSKTWDSMLYIQWHPAITKCHGTEKNVRYSGIFVIAKTPL